MMKAHKPSQGKGRCKGKKKKGNRQTTSFSSHPPMAPDSTFRSLFVFSLLSYAMVLCLRLLIKEQGKEQGKEEEEKSRVLDWLLAWLLYRSASPVIGNVEIINALSERATIFLPLLPPPPCAVHVTIYYTTRKRKGKREKKRKERKIGKKMG